MKCYSAEQIYEMWKAGVAEGGIMEIQEKWNQLEDWDHAGWERVARELSPDWIALADGLSDHKESIQNLQRAIEGSGLGSIVDGKPEHEILNQMAAAVITFGALEATLRKES